MIRTEPSNSRVRRSRSPEHWTQPRIPLPSPASNQEPNTRVLWRGIDMVPLHLRNLTVSLPWSGSIFTIRPMVLQGVCLPEDHQEIVVLEVPALGALEIT